MLNDLKRFLAHLTDAQLCLIDGAASEPSMDIQDDGLRQRIIQPLIRAEWARRAECFRIQTDENEN